MKNIENFNNPLSPLISLAAALDEADLQNLDLPLERPGLLEPFLDPEGPAALPEERRAADAALDGWPGDRAGDRAGDIARAGGLPRLRRALWNGEAMCVGEDEIEALGLEEEPEDG